MQAGERCPGWLCSELGERKMSESNVMQNTNECASKWDRVKIHRSVKLSALFLNTEGYMAVVSLTVSTR